MCSLSSDENSRSWSTGSGLPGDNEKEYLLTRQICFPWCYRRATLMSLAEFVKESTDTTRPEIGKAAELQSLLELLSKQKPTQIFAISVTSNW
jgi:hypothetical protein